MPEENSPTGTPAATATSQSPPAARQWSFGELIWHRAIRHVYHPRVAPIELKFGAKDELYDIVARTIGDRPITYLEFGVYRGDSMAKMAKRFTDPRSEFIGFDSFEGLPEDWGAIGAGTFTTSGSLPGIDDPRVRFVRGWFQNTLLPYLSLRPVTRPTLVHFDADLYSSTLFLMTALWYHVPEYYFIFDEFSGDEVTAMFDFSRAYPVDFEFFAAVREPNFDYFPAPRQLFGRLWQVPYDPKAGGPGGTPATSPVPGKAT